MEFQQILEALERMERMYMGGNSAPHRQMERIREAAEAWRMKDEVLEMEYEMGVYDV